MLNNQPPEKAVKNYEGFLSVHSIFYTIQGEGPFTGTPAVFVRVAGCNLQCPFCDTEYTQGRVNMTPKEIVARAIELYPETNNQKPFAVITGGEPFRQNLQELFVTFLKEGWYVQVETNGTLKPSVWMYNKNPIKRSGVYIVCSPKTGRVNKYTQEFACCFKYVMDATNIGEDGLPTLALEHTAAPILQRPPEGKPIYLQPMDYGKGQEKLNNLALQACVKSCLTHGYMLQLQTHKIAGLP